MQLVGLSLQGRSTPSLSVDLLEEASGKQDYILDYLTEEVLRLQPGSIQTFLLRTSILSRLSAPLCDAVLQQQGSQQVLEFLERSNLFVTALDRQRHWYRYHALFAEALCSRLVQTLTLLHMFWKRRNASHEHGMESTKRKKLFRELYEQRKTPS